MSSLTGEGMDKLWDIMSGYHQLMVDNGDLQIKREKQVRGSFYCKCSGICHLVLVRLPDRWRQGNCYLVS